MKCKIITILSLILVCMTACSSNENSQDNVKTSDTNETSSMNEDNTTEALNDDESNVNTEDLTSDNQTSNNKVDIESTKNPETTNSNNTEETTTKHLHIFSNATCTEPSKCSCGATEGKALGHKWSEATCEKPKTCATCNKTEGDKIAHVYEGVKCKFCQQTHDKTLVIGKTYCSQLITFEDAAHTVSLVFSEDGKVWSSYSFYTSDKAVAEEEAFDLENKIVENGVTYYCIGGGGGGEEIYTVADKEITLFYENEGKKEITKKLTIMPDGTLQTVYSDGDMYTTEQSFK